MSMLCLLLCRTLTLLPTTRFLFPGWWKALSRNIKLCRFLILQTRGHCRVSLFIFEVLCFLQKNIPAIDEQAKEQEAAYKHFCAESSKNIGDIKVELAKWEAMKPVEEMNLEEALDAGLIGTTIKGIPHPDVPSFWPHDEVG